MVEGPRLLSTCVILAGGLGTRLHAVTGDRYPKAMVEVAGRPFVDWQLRLLAAQGIKRVVLCVGHRAEMIEAFVRDGKSWNLEVSYSPDGPQLLGTGGALRLALDRGLLPEHFFVLYGDSYLPTSFQKVAETFVNSHRLGLMTVYHNAGRIEPSNCCVQNGQLLAYVKKSEVRERLGREKGWAFEWVDYGLSILSRQLLTLIPSQVPSDLAELLSQVSLRQELACQAMPEAYFEVGSEKGLKELEKWLSKK